MKVTQEKLPASQIGLEIEITPEMSSKAYEKALQEFTRSANIPGFRKGKVPRQVLLQRFGSSRIKATVVEDLIQDSLKKAIENEKIQTMGQFSLRSSFDELVEQFEPGSPLVFAAAVDVPPEVKLGEYTGLAVQAEEVKYDPNRVDEVLEDYRKRSATLVPIEGRAAESGDVAIVDFAGVFTPSDAPDDAEPSEIPGGSAEDFQIELSEGKFIPGFIEGVLGMSPGDTKEVEVTFPEDYPQQDLAGRPAVFTITLKELKTQELPELDDDFAQEVSAFETLAELRESLETRYQKEAEQKTKDNKQEALLTELVKHVEVELPETLVKQEVDYSVTQTAMQFSKQGMDVKKMFTQEIVDMLRQQARPESITRIQRTLALGEVAKQQSLEVDASAIEAKMNEVLAEYAGQENEIDRDRLREVVSEDLLKDKILSWLEEHGTVELVPEGSLTPDEDETIEAEFEELAEVDADAANLAEASEATIEVAAAEVVEDPEAEIAEDATDATDKAEPPAEAAKKGKGKSGKQTPKTGSK
jgi:trigger factor